MKYLKDEAEYVRKLREAMDLPERAHPAVSVICEKEILGTKLWWLGPDQSDPCYCVRLKGHDGECACEHNLPER